MNLLLEADLTARALLWDPDPDMAKARLRAWGGVVEAAADLWVAIPTRLGEPGGDPVTGPGMSTVHRRTQRMAQAPSWGAWPGAGPSDPQMESVASSLTRAAALVRGRLDPDPSGGLSPLGHRDADAARTRIMHVLYVAAHAVVAPLGRHVREVEQRSSSRARPVPGDSPVRARVAWRQVGVTERLVGSYLRERWPAALAGEYRPPVGVPHLEQALARWDAVAHRSLAGSPTVGNLATVARVQTDLAAATRQLTAAAATHGLISHGEHAARVEPTLTGLEASWGALGRDLGSLTGRQRRPDPALVMAGQEVRAVLRELTHDQAVLASPATIAGRVDLSDAVASLQRGLTCGADLAHVVRAAAADPGLTASVRGIHTLVQSGQVVPVSARDLHLDRPMPLPDGVRTVLVRQAGRAVDTAVVADSVGIMRSAAQAPALSVSTSAMGTVAVVATPAVLSGRHQQSRVPPSLHSPTPGVGCER